jgi:hypothetical protein
MSLFRTTTELKQYVAIDANTKFGTLKPSIDDAQERFIKPLLGVDFYNEFVSAYEAATNVPDDLTNDQKALLPFIQRALAYYALYLSIDEIGVTVGELGVQQSYNQNSQPAPQNKVARLTMKYISAADIAADKLLEYLEQNATVSKYNKWFSDMEANTAMSGCIVYKTAIASKYIDIKESRRVFLRLKKRIKEIEASYVKRLICSDQYDELVTQIKTGSLTNPNKSLMAVLEPVITKKALYLTLPTMAISIEADGLTLFSSNDTVIQKSVAGTEEKKQLMNSLRDGELGYMEDEQKVKAFIEENIADYPLIEASECWTSKPTDGSIKWQPTNDPCNKHFSV